MGNTMKTINTYINEKLRLTTKHQYTCQPENKKELQQIIIQRIEDEGPQCDLNDIDVSKITDMRCLFDVEIDKIFKDFNGDISQWDVSNVADMGFMFYKCEKFNSDISNWNVSNVENMRYMFGYCNNFNCDLSQWDTVNVKNMFAMFRGCKLFNQNLNSWDASKVEFMGYAFKDCPAQPDWYDKDKLED